ncbi:hypothetical protein TrCOL_g10925 [Triparma columacea]|nr:hypothetical protein TrCOL_g10925 [Triparma columacea]
MIVADEEGGVAEGAAGGEGGVEEQAREAHAMEEVGETGALQDERRPVVNSAEEDLIMIQRLQSALETTVEELQIRSEELSEAQYDVKELSAALEEQGNEVKRIEDVMDGVKGELEDVRMKYDDCERQRREIEYREKEANLFVNQLREEFKKLRQGIRGEGGGELESMINEAGLGDDEQDEPFDASVEPAVGDSGDSGHGDDEAIIPPPPPPVDSPPGTPPPPPPPQVKRHDAELEDTKKSVEALAIAAAATHEASKRERELVSDLSEMTRRFIDLKMQLEESKGDIELLSGNGGKGELAKEAVRLRKTLDRKSRDVQSVMLKGQELHMLNNTLQSKLANREQHVEYLEASLKDLQDAHRLFIKESRGTNVKLGEENKRLRRALEQMEGGFKGAGSPNKVVVPIRGGGGKARKGSSNAGSPRSERKGKRKDSKGGEEEAAKGVDWSPMKEGATPVMSGELVKEKTEAYFGASDSSSGTEDDDDDAVYARAAAATAKAIQMQKKKHKRLSSKLSGLKTLMPKKGSLVGKILGTLGTGGDDSGDNGSPKSDKGLGEDGNEEPSPPRREKRSESWLFGGSKRGSSSS